MRISFYISDKIKTTNINILQRIHNIMNEMGIDNLTPKEFKNLGYVNRKINGTWN
jgi:hypothetical protein